MQKEEAIDQKSGQIEKKEKELEFRESENIEKENELKKSFERYRLELERIAGLSQQDAKAMLLKELEDELRFEATNLRGNSVQGQPFFMGLQLLIIYFMSGCRFLFRGLL